MNSSTPSITSDTDLLRYYLLGELDDEAAGTVELRLLADDAFFELAEAVEGDLLAELARGTLPAAAGKRVRRRLAASPRGQARLALIQGLRELADDPAVEPAAPLPFRPRPVAPPQTSYLKWGTLAASLLVAVGGLWLAMQTVRPGSTRAYLTGNGATETLSQAVKRHGSPLPSATPIPATPSAPAPPRDRIAHAPKPKPASPALVTQIAILSLSTTRSAEATRQDVRPEPGKRYLAFHLPLDAGEPYTTYSAVLLDSTGAEVWQQGGLRPQSIDGNPTVVLKRSWAKLPAGEYQIKLYGEGADGQKLVGAPEFTIRTP